jgi:hypothetical protein
MGFSDEVTVMLADGEHPEHVANLHLGERRITAEADHELLAAIPQRRTNRRAFMQRPVAAAATDAMRTAAADEGATLVRLDPTKKRELGHLIDEADRLQLGDPAFRAELSSWLTTFGSRRRDGIPFVEKEYGSALPFTVMHSLRSPTLGSELGELEAQHVVGAPVVFVLGTPSDDPTDWLACGQALEAVLLRATALGLSASFVNQVLELPELRGRVAELLPEIGYPQMVLRIGYAAEPVRHAAPRRELADVLEVVRAG